MNLRPFTKWTGGKRQLLTELEARLPKSFDTYYEPFIGGGALFFHLIPQKAVINDYNSEIINCYKVIKENPHELVRELGIHASRNSKEYYLEIRSADRDGRIKDFSDAEKAARILYMLKVNFNGLYRVNSKNQFNVPYGRYKNPKILDSQLILQISDYLNSNKIEILNSDFEECVKSAQPGDFVYFDPPYIPVNKTSNFTSYTENKFSLLDQYRLRDTINSLTDKNIYVILSNSCVPEIFDMYRDYSISTVKASRAINSNPRRRSGVEEVLISNF